MIQKETRNFLHSDAIKTVNESCRKFHHHTKLRMTSHHSPYYSIHDHQKSKSFRRLCTPGDGWLFGAAHAAVQVAFAKQQKTLTKREKRWMLSLGPVNATWVYGRMSAQPHHQACQQSTENIQAAMPRSRSMVSDIWHKHNSTDIIASTITSSWDFKDFLFRRRFFQLIPSWNMQQNNRRNGKIEFFVSDWFSLCFVATILPFKCHLKLTRKQSAASVVTREGGASRAPANKGSDCIWLLYKIFAENSQQTKEKLSRLTGKSRNANSSKPSKVELRK